SYLASFRDHMGDVPTVIEFRHRSWAQATVLEWLSNRQLGFCCVDSPAAMLHQQPQFDALLPPMAVVTAPIAYVRFHGRNAAKWWQHEHAYERYDYSYTQTELSEWMPKLQNLQQQAQQVYVFANNCYKSQSITTARHLKAMLGIETASSHKQLELL
ncbi:MAG TPA: DUF72 domain-containing protein, partial [Candidatus Caenarcaniphilales bacterium]